ncbi:MAG: hypothetical protein ABIK73_06715 [candidate division WOR-3 bacterium]
MYKGFYEQIKKALGVFFDEFEIRTIGFGGFERLPTDAGRLSQDLNILLVRPVMIEEDFFDAQRTQRRNTTLWRIYYIRRWDGNFDAFDVMLEHAERMLEVLNKVRFEAFRLEKKEFVFEVVPIAQQVRRINTESDAELWFLQNPEINLQCIVLEMEITSLIK